MEYTQEIEIALPRSRVVELFDDPENLPKWQEGLQSFELVSGEAGQVGAKSRLVYKQGRRTIELIETIIRRDLPDAFDGAYEARGVYNLSENRFTEIGPDRTKWVSRSATNR